MKPMANRLFTSEVSNPRVDAALLLLRLEPAFIYMAGYITGLLAKPGRHSTDASLFAKSTSLAT